MHGDGDAALLEGVAKDAFATVYASHILEHMPDPVTAVRRWYEVLAPGGHLVIMVPHRDLYERRIRLPSVWNDDHKFFWHPEVGDGQDTLGLRDVVCQAAPGVEVVSVRVLDTGWLPVPLDEHAIGEYSIEIVARKPL